MSAKKPLFYGWLIVAASVIILAFMWALPMSCFSLFITPITKDLGLTQTSVSLCSTIVSITAMLCSPFVGRILEKSNVKIVMSCSVAAVAIGFIGYSIAQSVVVFYLSAIIIGIGLNGSSTLAVSIIVKNWFVGKRGLATSIALAGSGVGGMIFSPLISTMIASNGWRFTYRLLAILIAVIVIPIILILISKNPEDKGLVAYQDSSIKQQKTVQTAGINLSLAQLKGKPILWVYVFSSFLMAMAVGGVLMHAPSYLTLNAGYTSATAGNVVAIYLAIAIAGKIILGAIYDAKGATAGIIFGTGTFIISAICLLFAGSFPLLVLFTLFYGFGTCCGTVTPSVLTSKIFGSQHYGEIIGFTNLFGQLGIALGVPLLALIYDITGTYTIAWILCIIGGVLSILGMLYTVQTAKTMAGSTPLSEQSTQTT